MRHRFSFCWIIGLALLAGCARQGGGWDAEGRGMSPRRYTCVRATAPVVVDGRLDDAAWAAAAWTEPFVDIEGSRRPAPRFVTRAAMLWDEQYFYIAAELEEPHVWGRLARHDDIVFHDNDFEVFIDPDGDGLNYYEIEVNALNTVFDLLLDKPYSRAGPIEKPAHHEWNLAGLKTAVHVKGTLNDPRDRDAGWTLEMALPWASLAERTRMPCPPNNGDEWRVNFSRVEWRHETQDGQYRITPGTKEDNWVWSPQGVVDMHRPEKWGYVRFAARAM